MSSAPAPSVRQVAVGDYLTSGTSVFQVKRFLKEGTFGNVAECLRFSDMKKVAIKIIKKRDDCKTVAEIEASNLSKLRSLDPDKCNIVRWYQLFIDGGHFCLEFERLDRSLYDLMKGRRYEPLPLKEIRPIVQQIANALNHLKDAGLIHADLKLDNVMLVNHDREPYKVKVIDFGLAGHVSAARQGAYIQTRPYRAPEILLALPYTEAIDMWSLGCLAAALYRGSLLYRGNNMYDMMRCIVTVQGMPPDHMLHHGRLTSRYFKRDHLNSTTRLWKLKSPEEFYRETGLQQHETRPVRLRSLDDLLQSRNITPVVTADQVAFKADVVMFVDMLKGMLALDATKRLTPRQVLEHPFTSLNHMTCFYPLSSHVRSCYEIMNVCQKTQASNSGTAVSGSSSTANIDQQNRTHSASSDPCTSTQSTAVKSGIKRKADDEDGNTPEASHRSKRLKPTPDKKSPASASTLCVRCKRKLADDEDLGRQQEDSGHKKRFRTSPVVPPTPCSRATKRRMSPDNDDEDRERKRVRHSGTQEYSGVK